MGTLIFVLIVLELYIMLRHLITKATEIALLHFFSPGDTFQFVLSSNYRSFGLGAFIEQEYGIRVFIKVVHITIAFHYIKTSQPVNTIVSPKELTEEQRHEMNLKNDVYTALHNMNLKELTELHKVMMQQFCDFNQFKSSKD